MLRDILSIPSCYKHEGLIVDFLKEFGQSNGFKVSIDHRNNVYFTKGVPENGGYYPCVVAHTDTVHTDQIRMVSEGTRISIVESVVSGKQRLYGLNPNTEKETGIGGDNKCGVYIALMMMLEFDVIKSAFFVEEEIGMMGSKEADDDFFSDVGYAIQFDAPTRNWFSYKLMGVPLWNESFIGILKPVLDEFGIDNITSKDPFTDVLQIRKKYGICCAVFPTGYYDQHSRYEYVIPEETEECVFIGKRAINALGCKKYLFE